ncbi:GntG family PLP-dependent aldolase [Streptomyces sp. Je 1-369]|uniref:GntG family PLP-dependent aldolase n=1 Tax=Streptomyces sp. Je 1-369 TaxID=2966192 RepID=UPI0022858061|nr:GntG family PLP-dependent aldolase [Streptomyces sp. Je 1-369]WAL96814.1 beta-eliminating lyase-related protein [Streptomyces sp. Je 1-369]
MSGAAHLDFRSDTRTAPDAVMRRAMAAARVGDDAYGDDPTVGRLESEGARLLGTEAAVLLPSSTMSNLVAVLAAAPAEGTPLIAGRATHIAHFEAAAMRRFARTPVTAVRQDSDGMLDAEPVRQALTTGDRHVVCMENTVMLCEGNALPPSSQTELAVLVEHHGAHLHLDGARLANAAVAHGRPVSDMTAGAHSVTFCLAKGLGAPVGSLLGGSAEFVDRARGLRLDLGGTMHQSGVLAAAGLEALQRVPHLADDHALAELLATELDRVEGADVPAPSRRTNIVTVRLPGMPEQLLRQRLADRGVLVLPLFDGYVRFVVHREHDEASVAGAAAALVHAGERERGPRRSPSVLRSEGAM